MSTHNICFCGGLRKLLSGYPFLSGLVGLEFNGPVNTIKVMASRSVYLTTIFLRQA